MSDEHRRPVPEPVTLAEWDAGLPDDREGARLRAAAAADPDAAAVLEALAATRADLAAVETPEVPPEVADRWTAALAAEEPRTPPIRLMETSGRPAAPQDRVVEIRGRAAVRRRRDVRPLLAAAAAVAVVGIGLGALAHRPAPAGPAAGRVDLVALARSTLGTTDVGALADPARRSACLRAVAPAAVGEPLLGGRAVTLDGHPGVLLVLATGTPGDLRIITVDPACGPQGGTLLAQVVVTG